MITLSDITLMRGSHTLIEHGTAALYDKHKIGIIGRNGCGKSSLFAAIRGELQPDLGTISVPKDLRISSVAQQTPALDEAAIDYVIDGDKVLRDLERQREAAMNAGDGVKIAEIEDKLGIAGAWTVRARAESLMDGLGFAKDEMQKPVKEFSGGWRMRLNLAQALIAPSDLLLLDEPTNHLDLDTIMYLEGRLKAYEGTLLCISHDRDFLDAFCSDILHFESRKLMLYKGNYSAYEVLRAERIKAEKAARHKEEAILAHMQSFVDRFRYKATKAKQAQSLIKAIDRMKLTAVTQEESPFSFSFPEPERTVQVIASMAEVDAGYGENDKILDNINLQLLAGDRIGLLGRNGQGKSTFIKTLCGILKPLHGSVTLGKGIKIGYFAQHELEQLNPDKSGLEHLQAIDPKATERDLRSFLGSFAFSGDKALLKAGSLSGGEQARLALALIAFQKPNLLLLDEPTNHLDLEMREALSVALASYPGALLLVSHDRHLLEAIAEKLWLVDDGKVREFDGDLNDYKEYLNEKHKRFTESLKQQNAAHAALSASVKAYKSCEDKREMAQFRASLRPLKHKIAELEKQTEKKRCRLAEIDGIMAEGSIYQQGGAELENLMKERAVLTEAVEELENDWLMLQDELEQKVKAKEEGRC